MPIIFNKAASLNLDLHQKSLVSAKKLVTNIVKLAAATKIAFINIITGRGNHPNANGERGLIFKALPSWLASDEIDGLVKIVIRYVGRYKIILNPQLLKANAFQPSLKEDKQTELMFAVRSNANIDDKRALLTELLNQNRSILDETYNFGTTAFMVAAAHNKINEMDFLLEYERDTCIKCKLLKQTSDAGSTTLMFAMMHGHIEAVDYLLNKAPSLLKVKRKDGSSIFKIVGQMPDNERMLPTLYKHLKPHKREKGYTSLFKEYRILIEENNNLKTRAKIIFLNSNELINHKSRHWFFNDRMTEFLQKISKFQDSVKPMIQAIKSFKGGELESLKVRSVLKRVFDRYCQGNKLRSLFLRFNNFQKPIQNRYFKHALLHHVKPSFKPVKKGTMAPPKVSTNGQRQIANIGGPLKTKMTSAEQLQMLQQIGQEVKPPGIFFLQGKQKTGGNKQQVKLNKVNPDISQMPKQKRKVRYKSIMKQA